MQNSISDNKTMEKGIEGSNLFNPFLLTSLVYLSMAALAALENALISFGLVESFIGISWMRIHFITIGTVLQVLFGTLPSLIGRDEIARPRYDIWITLNTGFITFLIGRAVNVEVVIITGGTLLLVSTLLFLGQIIKLSPSSSSQSTIRKFTLTGVAFFLVGIVVGTGIWLNWAYYLKIKVPLEVHIHANNWGLISFIYASIILFIFNKYLPENLSPRTYWLFIVGTTGLVAGPWIGSIPVIVVGLLSHLTGTGILLFKAIAAVREYQSQVSVGMLTLFSSYLWFLAPVFVSPMVVFEIGDLPAKKIEGTAPEALVYGWVLMFLIAVLPFLLSKFNNIGEIVPYGNWTTLISFHLGGLFLWISIFLPDGDLFYGIAYILWTVGLVPIIIKLWNYIQVKV